MEISKGGLTDLQSVLTGKSSTRGLLRRGAGSNVLREVFVQRYYELYLTAQHWEDLRRFKNDNINIVTEQRNTQLAHEWLVYPYTEADTNPNAPAQPLNINYGL